jgi:uncharacterized membrane protein
MKEFLVIATEYAIVAIDAMALVVVVIGTFEAFFGGLRTMLGTATGHQKREVWLRYGRWLVAGLTFQLAADIIETSIAPTWQDVLRLAAIAVIRTFLNYFLEKDLTEVREKDREQRAEPAA